MLANSIWRALPPSSTRTVGQAARTGNKVRVLPNGYFAAASITAARPIQRFATTHAAQSSSRPASGGGNESAPKWTGSSVFGVAVAAGLLGWGFASVATGRSGKGAWLLDSEKQFPRYASMKEMEIVRWPFCCVYTFSSHDPK